MSQGVQTGQLAWFIIFGVLYPRTLVLLIFLSWEVMAKKRTVEQIMTCQVLW